MREQKLLTEINRMKEIMGIPLLTEGGIPGFFGDMLRNAFGETVQTATSKLQRVVGNIGGAISDDLADELAAALPRLLDDVNVWDELSDPVRKGFMRVFREIPELSEGIFDNILKQVDVTADEFAGAVIETMSSKNLSYEDAVLDILSASEVSDDVADIVQKNLRKTYDEMVSTGSNIVNPLSKRITTMEEALQIIETDLGFPLAKLRKIKGMTKVINDTARSMVGKTVGETKKMTDEALERIGANADFQKAWTRYTNTTWQNFKSDAQQVLNKLVIDYQQEGTRWYWPFGGDDILDAAGNPIVSLPRSAWKMTKNFAAVAFVINLWDNYVNKGMSFYEAATSEIHEFFIGTFGVAWNEITGAIQSYRDERGELTIDQTKAAFEDTANQLGKSLEDYEFTKIKRGVWRAVDFSDDPQDYAIIRHDGETHIMPWTSDLDGFNWDNLGDEWDKISDKVTSVFK